jgi:hypothetical protein
LEFGIFYLLFITMASFDLSWTPASGLNSTGQRVRYKESVSSTWLIAATLSPTADSYTIEDLDDNVVYDFSILNLCSFGGPTSGPVFQSIDFVCPSIVTSPSYNMVSFSFTHVGGSVTQYRVDLLDEEGSSIVTFKNITSPSGVVADSFTGLSATTSYNLRLTMKVGTTYSEVCDLVPFSTSSLPTCNMPTGLVVEPVESS